MSDERLNKRAVSPEVAERLSAEVCALSRSVVRSGFQLIRQIEECRQRNVHGALGMGWDAWLGTYCELSPSHVRRQLAISRGFAGLPTGELSSLGEGKAYKLLELPPSERTKAKWLEKAKDRSISLTTFCAAVDKAVPVNGNGENREEWRTFALKAPNSVYEALTEASEKLISVFQINATSPNAAFIGWELLATWVNQASAEEIAAVVAGREHVKSI